MEGPLKRDRRMNAPYTFLVSRRSASCVLFRKYVVVFFPESNIEMTAGKFSVNLTSGFEQVVAFRQILHCTARKRFTSCLKTEVDAQMAFLF